CLAVGRDGTRLGTGGGWYDRALPHRRPGALLVALAREDEVLDTVPTLPHDVSVDGWATELGWVIVDR
ncbi:5-formyltetrahydrofolate cyclo-ligase, partial [Tessaracoccus lubricantis]